MFAVLVHQIRNDDDQLVKIYLQHFSVLAIIALIKLAALAYYIVLTDKISQSYGLSNLNRVNFYLTRL